MKVLPFQGIYYSPEYFNKDISQLIMPFSYEICKSMQERLYELHPYNFIRLNYPKQLKIDTIIDNYAVRASQFLHLWLRKKILVKEEKETFYQYIQKYKRGDKEFERRGLITLIDPSHLIIKPLCKENFSQNVMSMKKNLYRKSGIHTEPSIVGIIDGRNILNKYLTQEENWELLLKANEGNRTMGYLYKLNSSNLMLKIQSILKRYNLYLIKNKLPYELSDRKKVLGIIYNLKDENIELLSEDLNLQNTKEMKETLIKKLRQSSSIPFSIKFHPSIKVGYIMG